MRLFLAMELPDTVKEALAATSREMADTGARAAWVRPEGMHLTLRFLGECPAETPERLVNKLTDRLAGYDSVRMLVAGIDAFPNRRRPAVVWVGMRVLSGDLGGLQTTIEEAVRALGWAADTKPFHPHVTLARVRDLSRAGRLVPVLEEYTGRNPTFGEEFSVAHVVLYSSRLLPGGAVYTPEASFRLGIS